MTIDTPYQHNTGGIYEFQIIDGGNPQLWQKRNHQSRNLVMEAPPFIDLLGLTFERLDSGDILVKLPMRDELIGNLETGTVHGGAILAMLDVTGELAVFQKLRKDMQDQSLEDQMKRLSKVKTIDMRVDYLRPPKGNEFIGTASILRGE